MKYCKPELEKKVDELIHELQHALEEERIEAFNKLHSKFCPYCGIEESTDAKDGGRKCQCQNDE